MRVVGGRAVIYVRQSKDTLLTGLAVDRQRDACLALCESMGLDVIEVLVENDTSARKGPRPVYDRMIGMVAAGAVDVIVAYHVDRLVRRLADLESLIETCQRHGVRVATVSGDLDLSNDAGRLVGRILASVAAGEVERKSARQKLAAEQAARRGVPAGGPRPFGYAADRVTLDPGEAGAVRGAYEAFLSGRPLSGIARDLNAAGWVTTRGGPWRHNAVRSLILNPRNAGLRAYGPVGPDGRVTPRVVVGPAAWEGIVPEDTWRAACAYLASEQRRTNRNGGERRWLLTGLAWCGACPEGEARVICTYRQDRRRVYRCPTRGHLVRAADPIDELVEAATIERLSLPDAVADVFPAGGDSRRWSLRATEIRALLDGLAEAYAGQVIDLRQLTVGTEGLRRELAEVEVRLAASTQGNVLARVVGAPDAKAAWDGLDIDQRRIAVRALWRITILNTGPGRRVFDPRTVRMDRI